MISWDIDVIIYSPQNRQKVIDQAAIAAALSPGPTPEAGQYGTGVIKWSGGFNNKTGKENDFGFIETKTGELFFHKSNVISPWEHLSASTRVMFRCVKSRGDKMAASEVGALEGFPDEAMLKFISVAENATEVPSRISTEEGLLKVFLVSSGMLRHEALKRLVKSASGVTLSKLADFIAANFSIDARAGLLGILSSPALLREEAFGLRIILPRHLHLTILAKLSTLTAHQQETASVLKKPENNEYDESMFWNKFAPNDPQNTLYSQAPAWVKVQVCRMYYSDFLRRWNAVFDNLSNVVTRLAAAPVYASLTKEDRQLAELWAGKGASQGTLARMLSARAAELAAKTFYRDQGCEVEDVAIGQTSGHSQDWRTHDLLIDGAVAIDVKNSRLPINNRLSYVEHTVPKFKLDRRGENVRIAGVLSPYFSLDDINNASSAKSGIFNSLQDPGHGKLGRDDIVYLGETHANHFEQLVRAYQSSAFSLNRRQLHIIPNWLFDYPAFWYKDYTASLRALIEDTAWPQEDEWQYTLRDNEIEDAFRKFCAIGIDVPTALSMHLDRWKVEFYSSLKEYLETLPRLPAIYLMVIKDFTEKLSEPPPNFSPEDYKALLFQANGEKSEMIPLGIIDPLRIVNRLINTLSVLWSKREVLQLAKLVTFKFTGLGMVLGKAIGDTKWTTILAYCGGSVYKKNEQGGIEINSEGKPEFLSKCGNSPLTLGVQKTCDTCSHLICDKCGYCCKQCETVHLVKLANDEKEKNSDGGNGYRQSSLRGQPIWEAYDEMGDNEVPYPFHEPPD